MNLLERQDSETHRGRVLGELEAKIGGEVTATVGLITFKESCLESDCPLGFP